jgi:hypothetical protein
MAAVTNKAREIKAMENALLNPQPLPTGPTVEQQATDARRKSLLGRDRGLFGTVQTGFRGLLNIGDPYTPRKTLLGE